MHRQKGEKIDPANFPVTTATKGDKQWKELVNGELADINVVEQYLLGGFRPEMSNLDKGNGMPIVEVRKSRA